MSRKPGGPRAGEPVPGEQIDGYDNLILLCRNDHRLVDDQPAVYTVERLVTIKREHEARIALLRSESTDVPDREGELRRLLAMSYARCVERWQAVGVSYAMARELADDEAIGALQFEPSETAPVTVLVGDVGAGKSLAGERRHQQAIRDALNRREAPAPVWMRAADTGRDLGSAVADAVRLTGFGRAHPVSLVIDGLDELGPTEALDVLSQARRLAVAKPGSAILLTTRLLPGVGNRDEQVAVPPLEDSGALRLIERVSGVEKVSPAKWPPSVREAVRRPLFALAMADELARDGGSSPSTAAEMLDGLIRRALGTQWRQLEPALVATAIESLRRHGGPVPVGEVVRADSLEALLATRLVIEEKGHLRFPLIAFAQWFAAQAILDDQLDVEALLEDEAALELWRYPLSVAMARAPAAVVDEVMNALVRRSPAYASLVIDASVREFGDAAEITSLEPSAVGNSIRTAFLAWLFGLGPLGTHLAPWRGTTAPALALRMDNGELTTAWSDGASTGNAKVVSLPPDWERGGGFIPGRVARPALTTGLAWRWSHDELAERLQAWLDAGDLPLLGSPLEAEEVWRIMTEWLGHPNGIVGSMDLAKFVDPEFESNAPEDQRAAAALMRETLLRHVDADSVLHPPWPGPDIVTAEKTVKFSQQRIIERAEAIYRTVLDAYQHFAETLFERLAPRMPLAASLPADARGSIRPGAPPYVSWWLEPLASGPNTAHFEPDPMVGLSSMPGQIRVPENELRDHADRLKTARPEAAMWITSAWHPEPLEIWDAAPGSRILRRLLKEDLRQIAWVGQPYDGSGEGPLDVTEFLRFVDSHTSSK